MKTPSLLAGLCALSLTASSCQSDAGIVHHRDPGALGPYSAAVEAAPFVFLAGKIGAKDAASFADEARSAMDAVRTELAKHGLGFSGVVSATVYLTDMARYGEFNEIYAGYFASPRFPARACVAVRELPRKARVEVQVIARRPARATKTR